MIPSELLTHTVLPPSSVRETLVLNDLVQSSIMKNQLEGAGTQEQIRRRNPVRCSWLFVSNMKAKHYALFWGPGLEVEGSQEIARPGLSVCFWTLWSQRKGHYEFDYF